MHVPHTLAIAMDHACHIDLSSSQVSAIGTEEHVARIGQFHDRINLTFGLDLSTQVRMDACQHTQIVASACSLIDRLRRLAQFFIRSSTRSTRSAWPKDEAVNTNGGKEACQAYILSNGSAPSGGIAETTTTIQSRETQTISI